MTEHIVIAGPWRRVSDTERKRAEYLARRPHLAKALALQRRESALQLVVDNKTVERR